MKRVMEPFLVPNRTISSKSECTVVFCLKTKVVLSVSCQIFNFLSFSFNSYILVYFRFIKLF